MHKTELIALPCGTCIQPELVADVSVVETFKDEQRSGKLVLRRKDDPQNFSVRIRMSHGGYYFVKPSGNQTASSLQLAIVKDINDAIRNANERLDVYPDTT